MSLCDRCFAPGQCCKRMYLSNKEGPFTVWLDRDITEQMKDKELPFVAIGEILNKWVDEFGTGREYGVVLFTCPKLGKDGRCTIYENRPEVCKSFEAGSDPLCVHFGGAEGTSDIEIPYRL